MAALFPRRSVLVALPLTCAVAVASGSSIAAPAVARSQLEGAILAKFAQLAEGDQIALLDFADYLIERRGDAAATPILALFAAWQERISWGSNPTVSEEAAEAAFDEARVIYRKMRVLPVTRPADLAAKVLADSNMGDFGLEDSLIEECKTLIGSIV